MALDKSQECRANISLHGLAVRWVKPNDGPLSILFPPGLSFRVRRFLVIDECVVEATF